MTPERMAELVAWWVRVYTRGLPSPIARRRIGEIDADLHDHIADARSRGAGERRIALGILSRMARGLTADASWRRRVRRRKGSLVKSLVAVLAIALGAAAVVLGGMDDSPGAQLMGLALVVGAGVWLFRHARRRRPTTDAGPQE